MARTKNPVSANASVEVTPVPPTVSNDSQVVVSEAVKQQRGRKRKAQAEVSVAASGETAVPAVQVDVSAPAKKRARKSKNANAPEASAEASAASSASSSSDVVMADKVDDKTEAPVVVNKAPKAKREFIFMEEIDGTWQRTKFKYTQKRPGEAEQAGCKALTRHLKKAGVSKTSAPIALWEKDTTNVYFYNGEVVPLETPKIIEREGAKPYEVTHKTTCRVPEGQKNPRQFNSLGRGKGFKLVEAQ